MSKTSSSIDNPGHPVRAFLSRFHRDEAGAEYSLSVVLVFPIYIAFMAVIIEMTVLSHSGHALVASMQTAERTTRVWLLHRDALRQEGTSLDEMVHACVMRNLLPFVGTRIDERSSWDAQVASCLRRSGLSAAASRRYSQKHKFIADSLRVSLQLRRRETDGYLVRVEYDAPLWLATSAPLLATGWQRGNYVRTLSAETWVAVSHTTATHSNIGIPYSPAKTTHW